MIDDLIRAVAHGLWQSRGRPIGSAEQDWFAARALVNAVHDAQARTPSEFFHCFTRSNSVDDSFLTLESMLKLGLILTPEQLTFYPTPTTTQCRLSLAYIPPHELFQHSKRFGPYALRLKPYETIVRDFGASPVWYLPSFVKSDTGEAFSEHGNELAGGLASMQEWIHDMRNDPNRESQRHEPHRITRLVMRLLYPTHYRNTSDVEAFYFLQREWRIIRRDSVLDRIIDLTHDEREYLRGRNARFFDARVKVWSDAAQDMVYKARVDLTYRLNARFVDVVSEVIVPQQDVRRVEALSPGVPVFASERYEFGGYA